LLALLRKLRQEGRTIIFTSHKLDEVLAIADDITVLRAGRVVGSAKPGQTSPAKLGAMMMGEEIEFPHRTARALPGHAPVLAIRGLAAFDTRGVMRLNDIDLVVRPGEVVGVAGVAGSGQDELLAAIAGLIQPAKGSVTLDGRNITTWPIAARRAAGLGYISADRSREGLCLPATIADNVIAGRHRAVPFERFGLLRPSVISAHVRQALDAFAVVRRDEADPVRSLSGGNQQRVVIARELDRVPKLLIAAQPTRGVDIAGIAFIHREMLAYRDRGGAVLLISEELGELLQLCDRIVAMHHGRATGEMTGEQADIDSIGRLMLGEAA
jgi:simple sugar transport system ATP-binding protein